MLGAYARYNSANFDAPEDIVVQDVTSLTFGLDFTRTWLRAGAEYEIYDSTFSCTTLRACFKRSCSRRTRYPR